MAEAEVFVPKPRGEIVPCVSKRTTEKDTKSPSEISAGIGVSNHMLIFPI